MSIADLLSVQVAIALVRHLHGITEKVAGDPKQAQALLGFAREVARLRRDDHSQNCFRFERERWEKELKFKFLTLISKGPKLAISFPELFTKTLVEMRWDAIKKRYEEKKKRGSLSAEEEAHYQNALAKTELWRNDPREARANQHVLVAGAGSSDLSRLRIKANPTQSNRIKPHEPLTRSVRERKQGAHIYAALHPNEEE